MNATPERKILTLEGAREAIRWYRQLVSEWISGKRSDAEAFDLATLFFEDYFGSRVEGQDSIDPTLRKTADKQKQAVFNACRDTTSLQNAIEQYGESDLGGDDSSFVRRYHLDQCRSLRDGRWETFIKLSPVLPMIVS